MVREVLLTFTIIGLCSATFLTPAIVSSDLELKSQMIEFIAFPQSALNGTEVEIRIRCAEDVDLKFDVQFVLRSSQCDKEFFDINRQAKVKQLLNFYFDHEDEIPDGYTYDKILFYKSNVQTFNCKNNHGVMLFNDQKPHIPMRVVKVKPASTRLTRGTERRIRKREFPGLNGDSIDGGAKMSLSSWHPVQRIPMDGIYFLILKYNVINFPPGKGSYNVSMDVQWRGPYGYLSAIDYPLLSFYAVMCTIYILLAIVWLLLCLTYWKDILRIQYWIGAVILIGMVEKAMFYSEYSAMNANGTTVDGFIEFAELLSCLKRTMSRVLIIIVSVGYGVVKPRLGSTLNQVAGVGFVYFILSAIEALSRVSKNRSEADKEKQLAALPLITLEVIIFWWIFVSLLRTMRALRLRRNEVKLALYQHFTNTLCFAVAISVIFIIWILYMHNLQYCLIDWKDYWIDTAFWHMLFCMILIVIMVLWRPSQNNQRYAFTPLLDDSEDENDEDELFHSGYLPLSTVNQRTISETRQEAKKQDAAETSAKIEDDLKWIENNIPSAIVDTIFAGDELNEAEIKLERSKML